MQEEGGESPRRRIVASTAGLVVFTLLEQPGALLTQSHEAVQLRGIHVLADVQRGFEGVLDVQRGDLRLVLLFALEEEGEGTMLADEHTCLSLYSIRYGPSVWLVMVAALCCSIWGA